MKKVPCLALAVAIIVLCGTSHVEGCRWLLQGKRHVNSPPPIIYVPPYYPPNGPPLSRQIYQDEMDPMGVTTRGHGQGLGRPWPSYDPKEDYNPYGANGIKSSKPFEPHYSPGRQGHTEDIYHRDEIRTEETFTRGQRRGQNNNPKEDYKPTDVNGIKTSKPNMKVESVEPYYNQEDITYNKNEIKTKENLTRSQWRGRPSNGPKEDFKPDDDDNGIKILKPNTKVQSVESQYNQKEVYYKDEIKKKLVVKNCPKGSDKADDVNINTSKPRAGEECIEVVNI